MARINKAARIDETNAKIFVLYNKLIEATKANDVIARHDALYNLSWNMNNDELFMSLLTKFGKIQPQWITAELAEIIPRVEVARRDKAWAGLPVKFAENASVARTRVAEFAQKLTDAMTGSYSLSQVFEWSEKHFEHAATADVYGSLAVMVTTIEEKDPSVTSEAKFAKFNSWVEREIKHRARGRARSTNVTANLMEECLRVEWATVGERLIRLMTGW